MYQLPTTSAVVRQSMSRKAMIGLARQFLMSATTPQSDAHDVARDLTDVYNILVHESAEVCSNCHSRIRAPVHAESDRDVQNANTLGTGNDPLDALRRGADGCGGYIVDKADQYGQPLRYALRTFCKNCGRQGGTARDDCPSKIEMLVAVEPLVDRFAEAGIPINDDALRQAIRSLRSKEKYRGSETEIWQAATAVALKRARPRDCVRVTYRPASR